MERLRSLIGVVAILGIAWALCPAERRRRVQPKPVVAGLLMLVGFAILVLRTPLRGFFQIANGVVDQLLGFTRQGSEFVFGSLVTDTKTFGFVLAFQVLPTILFFAALTSVLYHLGVLPFVVRHIARFISRFLGTSGAETFSTVADIFVGQTEAPLTIRPYLAQMTDSELFACMTAGFATTAGAVLAAYVAMLGPYIPDIAGHLVACSVMCAPGGLAIAKLMMPEVGEPVTAGVRDIAVPRETTNVLDAIAVGATDGLRLAANVAAMLIVFLALTAMLNAGLGWVGGRIGMTLSLERLFAWVFSPLAWAMGVSSGDVGKVATLLGQKTVLNEFVAYTAMSKALAADPTWLSERSRLIAAYALCGFANFGSIGIQIGGYSALEPSRRPDLSRLALRAMIAGMLTTCLVACVAAVIV